jgi:protoporphyrinogen oxidase
MRKVKFLIIGAGPSGLGAAYRLKELGEQDYIIVEKTEHEGGISTSFRDSDGFLWEADHQLQYSNYKYFEKAIEKVIPSAQWLFHENESWIWLKNRFIPSPFHNNIRFLPENDVWNCLQGLISVNNLKNDLTVSNLNDWAFKTFGQGIAQEFMLPLNGKVWAYLAHRMSHHWISDNMPAISLERILENTIKKRTDVFWGPGNTFKFPLYEGSGAIWRSIANNVNRDKILFSSEVASINSRSKQALLTNGEIIKYENILSTIPLTILCKLIISMPSAILTAASNLRYSRSNFIGISLKGHPHQGIKNKYWMIFPESNCPFHRVSLFSNYSPYNVPDSNIYFSYIAEITESTLKPSNEAALIEDTIKGLKATKLISDEDVVVSQWFFSKEHGRPIPSLDRDDILDEVISYLDAINVYSRGKFGGWKHEVGNQDQDFMQGVEWADYMLHGALEETYKIKHRSLTPLLTDIYNLVLNHKEELLENNLHVSNLLPAN